jgi:hypothetical protein
MCNAGLYINVFSYLSLLSDIKIQKLACLNKKKSWKIINYINNSNSITGNFCGFGLKRRHLIFADWKSWHRKKNCLYFRKQQLKRCCDNQLVHITVILRSKNIFSSLERRKKNLQKLIVIFLDQNHRNLTPQKLPVIRYWFEKHSFYLSIDHLHISYFVSKIIHLTVISLYGRQFTNYFKIILKNWCPVHCLINLYKCLLNDAKGC